MYGSRPRNIRVMYYLKENKEECTFRSNARKFIWQGHQIKWDSSTEKLKKMCGILHIEKKGDIHPEKKKTSTSDPSTSKKSKKLTVNGTVPQSDTMLQTGKAQTGKKFIETYRSCQELPVFHIRKDSYFTNTLIQNSYLRDICTTHAQRR